MSSSLRLLLTLPVTMHKYSLEDLQQRFLGPQGDCDSIWEGFHPYSWACMQRSVSLLRRLAAVCRDNVNVANFDGSTALGWCRNVELTNLLVQLGARVSCERPEYGDTSLHQAAEAGHVDQLRVLLEEGGGRVALESFDHFGRTPLGCAAQEGHLAALEFLLEQGANPNAVDESVIGDTPLQEALREQHLLCAQALLNGGADPQLSIGLTTPPQHLAREAGQELSVMIEAAKRHKKQRRRKK